MGYVLVMAYEYTTVWLAGNNLAWKYRRGEVFVPSLTEEHLLKLNQMGLEQWRIASAVLLPSSTTPPRQEGFLVFLERLL